MRPLSNRGTGEVVNDAAYTPSVPLPRSAAPNCREGDRQYYVEDLKQDDCEVSHQHFSSVVS